MHIFLHRMGYTHAPVPRPHELDLLVRNRTYFEEVQSGRRTFVHWHSPQEHLGPMFLGFLKPRLHVLRRAYAERNCTLLLMTVLRDPVAHLVSDYFHFEMYRRQLAGNIPNDTRSLVEHARVFREVQLVQLSCARGCSDPTRKERGVAPYRPPPATAVRDVLGIFDLVGVTEELGTMQAALCRRLAIAQCPTSVKLNAVPSRKSLSNGFNGAPLSVDTAKALTAPGLPLHAELLATSPLTACVHSHMLRAWRWRGAGGANGTTQDATQDAGHGYGAHDAEFSSCWTPEA